ncbi:ABC transporter permease [Ancylothrix sp. C2]|uniref:ABC transporter permease n=1 Tax=Ancylothrix sp. D3o TaxID=2953691 RepID=UPI0021BA8358|nr:ABC transporter permease [Ancylothrix sp. D3o]MCT7950045.1 ABC transporter permease [Ancylothrix sp. D3o]
MKNLLDKLGNWNPQLLRELKGRLKGRNIFIAALASICGQLLVLYSFLRQIPIHPYNIMGDYCRLRDSYLPYQQQQYQLQNQVSNLRHSSGYSPPNTQFYMQFAEGTSKAEKIKLLDQKISQLGKLLNQNCPADGINLQLWWENHWPQIFVALSVCGFVVLLTVGTYMLISDLANEERRGTLNFIRLSPQSGNKIFLGKILGVPLLLYVAALVALPFHLYAGFSAGIPNHEILSYYLVVVGSCAFFYSGALLFGSMTSWLAGFQPWLGSGMIFLFLMMVNYKQILKSPFDFLNLFSPSVLLPYLINWTGKEYYDLPFRHGMINSWEWFYLPLGAAGFGVVLFVLCHYGLWTYWISQALNRRFDSDEATMLSKRQSYLITACFAVELLGFAVQSPNPSYSSQYLINLQSGLMLTFFLLLILMAALSPNRQVLLEWARYKHLAKRKESGVRVSVWQDLVWGEKSPTVVAMVVNCVIATAPMMAWILLWSAPFEAKETAFAGLMLLMSLVLICARLVQLTLLMKTPKRAFWAAGSVGSLLCVPPFALGILSIYAGTNNGGFWLLTMWPWEALKYVDLNQVFGLLGFEFVVFGVLSWQLHKQLRMFGESASKAALAAKRS